MRKHTKYARKVIVALIGFPLLIVGIILIPLPGPGLVTCFLALFILSTEFDWANKYFEKAKKEIKKIIDKGKAEYEKSKKDSE